MREAMSTAYGFQRPQDAQPSPQVAFLGAWGIIPQQAFWRVENPPKSQTCTCLHCLPICENFENGADLTAWGKLITMDLTQLCKR